MNDASVTWPSRHETSLIRKTRRIAEQYQGIMGQRHILTEDAINNRDAMALMLLKIRNTKRPEIMLMAEATILQVDKDALEQHIDDHVSAGGEIPRETKLDLTQLTDGIKAMDDSLKVYELRRMYGEDAYQDISRWSRQDTKSEVDKFETAIDVLRKNTKSHETRLGNMASATSINELGRKNQSVYGIRRENMAHCRSIYSTSQKEFVENRVQRHGLA